MKSQELKKQYSELKGSQMNILKLKICNETEAYAHSILDKSNYQSLRFDDSYELKDGKRVSGFTGDEGFIKCKIYIAKENYNKKM